MSAITYGNATATYPKFTGKLVRGWAVFDYYETFTLERVFAEFQDGTILATNWRKLSSHFNPKGQNWEKGNWIIPSNAEYIGSYEAPI